MKHDTRRTLGNDAQPNTPVWVLFLRRSVKYKAATVIHAAYLCVFAEQPGRRLHPSPSSFLIGCRQLPSWLFSNKHKRAKLIFKPQLLTNPFSHPLTCGPAACRLRSAALNGQNFTHKFHPLQSRSGKVDTQHWATTHTLLLFIIPSAPTFLHASIIK